MEDGGEEEKEEVRKRMYIGGGADNEMYRAEEDEVGGAE